MADTIPPSTQLKHRQPKTASEQSNTNSEKTPRKLTDMMKRVSGSQSDAEVMAKASKMRVTTQRYILILPAKRFVVL